MSDADLLRQYLENGAQTAFRTLVERHLNLVYSVARRHVPSAHLAEEVAQSVFVDLARQAHRIRPATPLVAWLHLVSRRTAIDVVRRESRRHAHEQEAAEIAAMKSTPSHWTAIEPLLDEAVETLNATDRTAVLLRFFENKSLREVGVALGASEDAAQKRVSRAIEQLHAFFLRRGVTVTAAGLAIDLSTHAIEAAPAALGTTIFAAGALSNASTATATFETSRIIAMTTLQKSAVVAALVVAGVAGLYETGVIARQSSDRQELREQIDRPAAEIRHLRSASDAAAARLKNVEAQIDTHLAASTAISASDAAIESQMKEWLLQMDGLKRILGQWPKLNIPELQLLTEQDWFSVASGDRDQYDSDEKLRRATAGLRHRAENIATGKIYQALNAYIRTHDGMLPDRPLDLAPQFDPPLDPAILERYEMLQTGKASDVPRARTMYIMAPKAPADPELDAFWSVGTSGYGNTSAMSYNIGAAQRQFAKTNGGQRATSADQLMPYLKWPVEAAAVQKFLRPQVPSGVP